MKQSSSHTPRNYKVFYVWKGDVVIHVGATMARGDKHVMETTRVRHGGNRVEVVEELQHTTTGAAYSRRLAHQIKNKLDHRRWRPKPAELLSRTRRVRACIVETHNLQDENGPAQRVTIGDHHEYRLAFRESKPIVLKR